MVVTPFMWTRQYKVPHKHKLNNQFIELHAKSKIPPTIALGFIV